LTCDARNVDPPTASPGSPSRSPTPKGPTQIPTDMPIEPPDPLPFPSTNPKDHMFCGVGLDDANSRCEIPCPTAKECPSGESKFMFGELFNYEDVYPDFKHLFVFLCLQYATLVHNVILEHSLQLHPHQEDRLLTRKLFYSNV